MGPAAARAPVVAAACGLLDVCAPLGFVLDDASVGLPSRAGVLVVVVVVVPDIVAVGVVAVEAGGGSGAFGGDSLPPHAAAPRRKMTTELRAILFMEDLPIHGASEVVARAMTVGTSVAARGTFATRVPRRQ